ncbi:enkurin-like [Argonauta hians]
MPAAMKKLPKEYITNLIPTEYVKKQNPPRYVSKFHNQVKIEKKQRQQEAKTMGPPTCRAPDAGDFLKKNAQRNVHVKPPLLEDKQKLKNRIACRSKKSDLPDKTDIPMYGMRTTKNFITENAVKAITALPKKVATKYCDTRNGDSHLLLPSGFRPHFIQKKDYGEIPKYLKQRKEDVKLLQDEYDAAVRKQLEDNTMKQLTDEEREDLLRGLKKNWEAVHHDFQGLSVMMDTIRKKYLKEKLEMLMKQLEEDISMIERHKRIYLADTRRGDIY